MSRRLHRGKSKFATEDCEGNGVIVSAPHTTQPATDGAARARLAKKPPVWHRRRWQLGALGLVLLVGIAVALSRSQSAPPTQNAQPAAAPLIAHGQIVPTQQARVGTQGGGVVQRLDATPGT